MLSTGPPLRPYLGCKQCTYLDSLINFQNIKFLSFGLHFSCFLPRMSQPLLIYLIGLPSYVKSKMFLWSNFSSTSPEENRHLFTVPQKSHYTASHILGAYLTVSYTIAFLVLFQILSQGLSTFYRMVLNLQSSCLCLLSTWYYRTTLSYGKSFILLTFKLQNIN